MFMTDAIVYRPEQAQDVYWAQEAGERGGRRAGEPDARGMLS